MESKDDKLVEMMDMMVRMQLVKSIDESLKSIVGGFKDDIMGSFKDIPLNELHDLSEAFEKLNEAVLKIINKEEKENGEV